MLTKPIDQLAEADFRALIANHTAESQTLDFKRVLPGRDNAARHEFCADVCAFANASGGDLLFGIDEDADGKAAAVVPLTENPDDEQLRLQDLALNGLEPRITGLQVRSVPVTGGHVFVVYVPRSWAGPHRVRTNQHFYLREGARKRQLDVPEIRSAFVRSENQAERIRSFRAERIGKILIGDTPVPLLAGTIGVLHIIPMQPREPAQTVDPMVYLRERCLPMVSGGDGGSFKVNLDGALQFRWGEHGSGGYTQFFRDGRVEAVRVFTTLLRNGRINIASVAYERELIEFYDQMTPEMLRLGLGPPFAVLYSLLRLSNAQLGLDREQFSGDDGRFDRDIVLLPDTTIENTTAGQFALRSMFDLVWQSAGIGASANYDSRGNWVGRR
jgi:hypothetical protein